MLCFIKNGYFVPDNELIHTTMKVKQPALDNLDEYGLLIQTKCKESQSYLLAKRNLLGQHKECKFFFSTFFSYH